MLYTDGIHLVADTIAELHAYCEKFHIKRCWFEKAKTHPHYDIPQKQLATIEYHIVVGLVRRVKIRKILLKSKEMLARQKAAEKLIGKRTFERLTK